MADLKKFRQNNGLTQKEVADYLEVSISFLSQIECGKRDVPPEKLSKLLNNPTGWDTAALKDDTKVGAGEKKQTNDFYKALMESMAQTTKCQEQMDRLIAILEKTICNKTAL